jgi:hypothetical protein
LAGASVLAGIVFTYTWLVMNKTFVQAKALKLPPTFSLVARSDLNSRIASLLRSYLESQVKAPDDFLENVQVISAVGELTSETTEAKIPGLCRELFREQKPYLIVQIQIAPKTPIFVTSLLYGGILQTADSYAGSKPAFVIYEVVSKDTLGPFDVDYSEELALCLTDSDKPGLHLFVGMDRTVSVPISTNLATVLLLGDLDIYSQVENVPIWFQ